MIDSAEWLMSVLNPILFLYSTNCIQNSLSFAQIIRLFDFSAFLFSFHMFSLFTTVLLAKTINICADALCSNDLKSSSVSHEVFIELMQQ